MIEPILRLLVVEENQDEINLILDHLHQGGIEAVYEIVHSAEGIRRALGKKEWDVVIADYTLPEFDGLTVLNLIKEIDTEIPFLMVSERLGEEMAVAAMKAGVDDYILKDNLSGLVPAIQAAVKVKEERRQKGDKLRESEALYRSVITAMAEGIVLQDTSGVILACNTNAERILGLTADQMMGRTSLDPRWRAIHEDGSPFPGETHPAMVTLYTGKPCTKVIMGVHKPDDTLTWISINSEPIFRTGEPMPYAVVASFSDITEQKNNERILRHQNEQLTALHKASLALIEQLEIETLLSEILKNAGRLMNTEHGYLFVREPESDLFVMRVGMGLFEARVGHQQVLNEGLTGQACQLKRSVTVNHYREWSGRLEGLDPLQAVVATPLYVGDKILGGFGLAYVEEGLIFDAEKLKLLEQFGALVSMALENARLYSTAREELVERQRSEETLRQSEERLRQITENMREIFFMVSRGFTEVIYVSPAYQKILQRSCESLYANSFSWLDAVVIEDRERIYKRLLKHHEELNEFYEEFKILRNDGTERCLSVRSQAVFNQRINDYRFVGIVEDITERKQAQEALQEKEAHLQYLYSELQAVSKAETEEHARRLALLDKMSREMNLAANQEQIFKMAVIYISQLIETKQSLIILFNEIKDSFEIVAFQGELPKTKVLNKSLPLTKKRLQRVIEEQRLLVYSTEEDGDLEDYKSLAMMIAPLMREGQLIGCVKVVREKNFNQRDEDLLLHLTSFLGLAIENRQHKKELEKAKEEAEEARFAAESANRAKSSFLANMSHELRTPLNGILGYAQLLSRDNNLTTKQKKGLNIIWQSGEHLLTLINDILDLSKIEINKMELHPTTFDLPKMLKELVDSFNIKAEEKGIYFVYECLSNLPIGVHGDEKRLRQVLLNLLSNAIKFTPAFGQVRLNAGMYAGKIRLEVEDTGIGIAEEACQYIFEPFYQTTEGANYNGTGLGLAISSKLVEMMGGEIYVKSELGKGSRFWIELSLPQISSYTTKKQAAQEKIIGFKGKAPKILVVDDNSQNRLLLNHMLTPLGFEIQEAENGSEGLSKAIEFEPEVILVDLRMPIMNGFEMIHRIRGLPTGKDKVIITISASAFTHSRERSLEAGSNEFLTKPFELAELLALLQRHLELEWLIEQEASSVEEEEEESSLESLIPPSHEEMQILLDLARKGNIRALMKEADKLTELDEQYRPFAKRLRLLTEEIRLREVRELIKMYM